MRKSLLGVLVLLLLLTAETFAQTRTVSGTVVSDEDNLPLPGVNVRIKDTSRGAITDLDGNYTIQASNEDILVYSFVGFLTQEIQVGNQSTINLTLMTDAKTLGEVVVVGYGTIERRELTGSVGSVNADVIRDVPALGIDQALQGRVAGVQITQNSGTPGAGISVRVRGSSSISASNQPLYVIDGVPMTTGDPSQLGFGGQSSNSLADLNPSDIESMEVLKDAAAAAIYGSRAANGVVLITTKRGADQRTQVNLNMYGGIQQVWRRPDFLDRRGYLDLMNDAIGGFVAGDLGIPRDEVGDQDLIDWFYGGLPFDENVNTDWVREVTRTAPIQNYELTLRGGNERTRYYISGSFFDQQGTVINSRFHRMSTRFNLDHDLNDRMTISLNSGISRSVQNRIVSDNSLNSPFANSLAASPLWPVYDEAGNYTRPQFFYSNPVAEGLENDNINQSIRIFSNALATYEVIPDLNVNVRVGADILNFQERRYTPDSYPGSASAAEGGSGSFSTNNPMKWVAEAFVDYRTTFNDRHTLNVVAGHNREENLITTSYVRGIQFPDDRFRYVGSAGLVNEGDNNFVTWGLESYFGRANYSLDDKYLFSASFRADASSRFGPNNRWGYFPSISAGWRLMDEDFFPEFDALSDLKLRASFGYTGNQEIGNFAWRGLVGAGNYLGTPSIFPVQLGNPDLKWENTAQTDIGIDASFFNGRLTLIADYYYKITRDLLFSRPIPTQSGFGTYQSNIGSVENRGFEFTISTVNMDVPNGLNWRSDINISFNRNKILELYQGEDVFYGFGGNSLVLREGQPIGTFYGLIADGVFATNEDVPEERRAFGIQAGDMNYRDINDDGIITDDDFTILGNSQPLFFGGFTNTFTYKNWDAQVFMQFSVGNEIWNAAGSFQEGMFANFFDDNNRSSVDNRWRSEENPGDGMVPRATIDVSANRNNQSNSTRFIEDGSYLRVKNLIVGYRLPQPVLDRIRVSSARVYFQAQNLLTFTGYSGFDPEVNFAGTDNITLGVDFYTFPQPRTFTLGLNIGF
ncbi:SusC/RagA family TonB-linked outer membrane protein [Litoribacter populi]|uniref:SusC/RagA family TonB-linked outer membrane protein n=1 Tax=Litoribacter populi TaxID=2598460 RepID=UPI00117E04E7|nr:TonB-dependent receptor [Litoribacter populi]